MMSSFDSVNIGILGLGVVGTGLVNLIQENCNELNQKTGCNIIIRKIAVLNLDKPRNYSIKGITLTDNAYDIIQDPEIERIGGIDLPAQDIFEAISKGKHVITANNTVRTRRT